MSKQTKRKSEIVRQLSDLSKNGWKNAKPVDYQPLEKELSVIDERFEAGKFAAIKWKLVDSKTGKEIKTGTTRMTFRDVPCTVVGFFYPHKPESTGKVHVMYATDEQDTFYPGVIGAEYRRVA